MADEDINKSIDELTASLEEERAARRAAEQGRAEAERRAQQHASRAGAAGNEVQRTRLQTLDSSLDQLKTQRDIMKARYRDASAEGDHDAVAEIAAEMGDIAARLLTLENGKAQLQYQIDNPPPPPGRPQDAQPFNSLTTTEKVDRVASSLSERSAAWVRRHPEWAQTEERVNALVGAHNAALARGRIADTPEYFVDIERILEIADAPPRNGVDHATDADAMSSAARPVRDTPPPAAPARSSGGGRTRTLNSSEREAARIAGQTDEEYAREQDVLLREGRITRH